MGVMRVDVDGLHSLASRCEYLADDLAAAGAPQISGMSWQETTAAVNTISADVGAAVQRLSARLSATATKLSGTAVDYTTHDAISAQEIRTTVV